MAKSTWFFKSRNDGSFEFFRFKIAMFSHAEKRKKKTSVAALITTRGALKVSPFTLGLICHVARMKPLWS